MKILVMGAGYVGMALLEALKGSPHEIYITTTRQERVEELKEFGKEVLYLAEDGTLKEWIDRCDAMVVLVAPKVAASYEETYFNTAKKITAALKGRTAPFYLVYTSSTSVYEVPLSQNGQCLLETEQCYLEGNQESCILRLGGIYGPGRELADRARRFSNQPMSGTGDEPTNHSHLEDIVASILFALEHRISGVYQVVNDDHPTRKELYSKLCVSLNLPPPLWTGQPVKTGYKVSNEKIKAAGFTFKHPRLL